MKLFNNEKYYRKNVCRRLNHSLLSLSWIYNKYSFKEIPKKPALHKIKFNLCCWGQVGTKDIVWAICLNKFYFHCTVLSIRRNKSSCVCLGGYKREYMNWIHKYQELFNSRIKSIELKQWLFYCIIFKKFYDVLNCNRRNVGVIFISPYILKNVWKRSLDTPLTQ